MICFEITTFKVQSRFSLAKILAALSIGASFFVSTTGIAFESQNAGNRFDGLYELAQENQGSNCPGRIAIKNRTGVIDVRSVDPNIPTNQRHTGIYYYQRSLTSTYEGYPVRCVDERVRIMLADSNSGGFLSQNSSSASYHSVSFRRSSDIYISLTKSSDGKLLGLEIRDLGTQMLQDAIPYSRSRSCIYSLVGSFDEAAPYIQEDNKQVGCRLKPMFL